LGLKGDAAAFVGRAASDKLLVAGLLVLLFAGWLAARLRADRLGRALFLVSSAVFVGALATRALVVPLLAASLAGVVAGLAGRRIGPGEKARIAVIAVLGIAFVSLAAVTTSADPTASATDVDPAAETRAALAHGNLFEARLWSERWAAETPDQRGEAALLLAEIDWSLGHRVLARGLAADVAIRATDAEVRRRASVHAAEWSESK